ncbi:hypothetical protein [Halobacterium bonnevillei]|uniref:hypothetical protein n=1 Tax=Halobacterium bonnevillei TaxID=2692200 RepID=UPI002D8102ED|nr:hypothetical protein [Halobacterium bonnevillei]
MTGCIGNGPAASSGGTTTGDDATTGRSDETGNSALDLREANVTGVETEPVTDGVRFDVTLYHDDDGEDGHANWWQVERLDGDRLGRRDLSHAHGTLEFTRSSTVQIPDDVDCVVVRGHDQTHGYGGQAMLLAIDDGATRTVRQGEDPDSFSSSDCP